MGKDSSTSPLALKAVAATFIVSGILAALEMFSGVTTGHISLNLGVIAIPVGFGLLRHRHLWRLCALVLAGLGVMLAAIVGIVMLSVNQPIHYSGLGQAGSLPAIVGVAFVVLLLLISAWQCWVLTRPHVKHLFTTAGKAA